MTHAPKPDATLAGLTAADFEVPKIGPREFPSPLDNPARGAQGRIELVPDGARVLASVETSAGAEVLPELAFEKAGPRSRIYFDPSRVKAGIVSCGGLSPGINSVIRSLVLELYHLYGVREITGFRYGYEGLNKQQGAAPLTLSPSVVTNIHRSGGSILGLGRGPQDVSQMVARLRELGINMLFAIGGDGTLAGAHALAAEAKRQDMKLSVVAVPKTIDNDIPFVDQTFGFDTAVEVAAHALAAAHTEATSARNGIAVVKLMGREAGFICAQATLASLDVNFCLVPEVPFALQGRGGLLEAIETRLRDGGHALIAVAEGCGIALADAGAEHDASGNLRFASQALDIGPRLCSEISAHFHARELAVTLKYIDPSYLIRSVAANASDNRRCDMLARHAVHAAMAGKSDLVVGHWNGCFTYVPLSLVTAFRKRISSCGELWSAVVSATGQHDLRGAGVVRVAPGALDA